MAKKVLFPSFEYERLLWKQSLPWVAGVDEVGRGALAGPIVAAAVVFDSSHEIIPGVCDSKMLTAASRQRLDLAIKATAMNWAIGVGSVELIDQQGIVAAQKYAMQSALDQLLSCDHILIDGLPYKTPLVHHWPAKVTFIVKGDQKSYSIAAASIIAKVYRDALMAELASQYPLYHWDDNVGYGTAHHRGAILKQGLTSQHRHLFCRKILAKK